MAISFHIVVLLFIAFALVDVALLSLRTLLSRQRHGLTLLYALMGVQEAMIVFEVLLTFGSLLSTTLVTAGMSGRIVSLCSFFFPLWLLRAFFTAFTMVYKNVLIPRWTAAARAEINAGVFAHSVRAWHVAGYGTVVVLDVVCCCLYFLSAVYVLGFVTDKTLYVPYHRRRWRHVQFERASRAAVALSDATRQQQQHAQQRKRGRSGGRGDAGANDDSKNEGSETFPVTTLARTPSFAQWQQRASHETLTRPNAQSLPPSNGTKAEIEGRGGVEQGGQNNAASGQRPSALPTFLSVSSSCVVGNGEEDLDSTAVFPRPAGSKAAAGRASLYCPHSTDGNALRENNGKAKTDRTAAFNAPLDAASRRRAVSDPSLMPPRPKPSNAFLPDLPPLHLLHRFAVNSKGEEDHLNQFAAALVEHGFSTQSPDQTTNVSPEVPHTTLQTGNRSGTGIPSTKTATTEREGSRSGLSAQAMASSRDGLANTASPEKALLGSTESNSTEDAARGAAAGRRVRRSASEPTLRHAGGTAKSSSGGRSSFRHMLSAWSGFNAGHEHSSSSATTEEQPQQPGSSSSSLTNWRRQSSDSKATPSLHTPPRKRAASRVRFALDGSGSGDTRGGHSTPPLPPRPRPSFRIDQATGNVVAVPSTNV
ncbi:hypothetical protein ABB37_00118 [Leptomonas pyrrhocoris]|uniref:Transmembrane protein n=1 Tax=Leptomonas pyrrhocoris TaxID=157538 RepID=A0A0N0DZX3_LEPPY|nr:hypothetical protein ABB37_00118 [Leptomonas pyrrhocoris]KPA85762.1 hypothetical protein ABB37_00118 [Leptomonas pyrrhocoris]|eukprot:XP_015664201.1 hypothetical protein ABB37_00118 [Leptomonas pyrrhocoris]